MCVRACVSSCLGGVSMLRPSLVKEKVKILFNLNLDQALQLGRRGDTICFILCIVSHSSFLQKSEKLKNCLKVYVNEEN